MQLKQPRRDLVWPFLGIGFRGSGGVLPFRLSDRVGESLDELSSILGSGGESIDTQGIERVQRMRAANSLPLWRYILDLDVACNGPRHGHHQIWGLRPGAWSDPAVWVVLVDQGMPAAWPAGLG